jgi:hypothetical protein
MSWQRISTPIDWILEKAGDQRIASIPTEYAGVNFRSRLEARWAAFFDLNGWEWQYEPVDLNGWMPDFLVRTELGRRTLMNGCVMLGGTADVYAEVKPVMEPNEVEACYQKAVSHGGDRWVLLLGIAPLEGTLGYLLDTPEGSQETRAYLHGVLGGYDPDTQNFSDQRSLWRDAGNRVQWRPRKVSNQ